MKYKYTYRNTAGELWQLSMYYTYGSMVGVCNIIFTVAVMALAVSRWNDAGIMMRCMMVLGCLLFTVIQPVMVYGRAVRRANAVTRDTKVCFDDSGIHVTYGDESSYMKWETIKRVSKKPTMIIVFSDTTHGFVLTNRVLGSGREAFYEYVASKVNKG